jgi:hypothetical protein
MKNKFNNGYYKLGDIGHIMNGQTFPQKFENNKDGKYKFIKVSDFNLPENCENIVNSNT